MNAPTDDGRRRCTWSSGDELLQAYHDTEWGVPVHDDHALFELLTLEGAQAGLSWLTILRRRDGYRRVFSGFDPRVVARFSDAKIEKILLDPGVVRHRQKITSVVNNAQVILQVQKRHGSLDDFLWRMGAGSDEAPVRARKMSKTLSSEGFGFVGPTICLSFMQASGMTNDHAKECFRFSELSEFRGQTSS